MANYQTPGPYLSFRRRRELLVPLQKKHGDANEQHRRDSLSAGEQKRESILTFTQRRVTSPHERSFL
jgi:hypothetical protein